MVDGLGKACGRTPFGRLARDGERWPGQVRRGERQERHERKIAGVEACGAQMRAGFAGFAGLCWARCFSPPRSGCQVPLALTQLLRSVEEAVRVHPTPGPGPFR